MKKGDICFKRRFRFKLQDDYFVIFFCLFLSSCISPIDFPIPNSEKEIFVEASFTDIPGKNKVVISYTSDLDENIEAISGASVWITSDLNETITFNEVNEGIYKTNSQIKGQAGTTYILNIELLDGTKIQSFPEMLSPPHKIDSVYGRVVTIPSEEDGYFDKGVQLFVDSKSIDGSIMNIRYDIQEYYVYRLSKSSEFIVTHDLCPNDNLPRPVCYKDSSNRSSINCYRQGIVSQIEVTTTNGLIDNIVSEYPLRFINESDDELEYEYTFKLRQFSISNRAYSYYKRLKEQNESAGSLFDRQRGNISGNLYNVENTKSIFGYFEVASVDQITRTFYQRDYNDEGFRPVPGLFSCSEEFELPSSSLVDFFFGTGVINSLFRSGNITEYGISHFFGGFGGKDKANIVSRICMDCDASGGRSIPPSFD